MKKYLKALRIAGLAAILALTFMLSWVSLANAATPHDDVCQGVALTGAACGGAGDGAAQISGIIKMVVNILSIIGGVAAVIVLIISGLRMITSNGGSDGVSSAKNGVIYALVGLVIIALAQVIVKYILGHVAQ